VLNIEEKHHDTISVLAIDSAGVMTACSSTSGLAWKLPGRVGDSPIIGHGLYVQPGVGGCVCTGLGELGAGICAAFVAVEVFRRGGTPIDAVSEVLDRLVKNFEITPQSQLGVIALHADGGFSTGSLRPGYQTAFRDSVRDEMLQPEVTLLGQ
jgi:L-asparaginase/N4-(beta-N-acetylglucosaminyl)-L-asparaginase